MFLHVSKLKDREFEVRSACKTAFFQSLMEMSILNKGFENNILNVHSFSIKEDTLAAIRIVKYFIVSSNGVLNILK